MQSSLPNNFNFARGPRTIVSSTIRTTLAVIYSTSRVPASLLFSQSVPVSFFLKFGHAR